MSLITVRNLKLGYEGTVIAEGFDFSVNEGDYLCIVGENGSGKTTLMKTLLGLQPPMGGTIEMEEQIRQEGIGYLPQQSAMQKDFPASVREIVLSGCLNHGRFRPFYSSDDRRRAEENMEKMGISDLAERSYRELSGGQQQRVLLARALCATGKVLLLDEPVSGLDPNVTAEMYRLIAKLNSEGITIIMISHDVRMAVRQATHILHVGSRLFYGSVEKYVNSDIGRYFLKMEGGDENAE
ncbi:MAG: ABC transporter ATP-binding protein [Erysipelotrichaceae bacterium]|nr:ABC transporter ATP-binding protein [Erysipelotrichaceae bacterium]